MKNSRSFIVSIPCVILCEKPWCYLFFKHQYESTDLLISVAQEHLRSDALPDTTMIRRESNTRPIVWKTHALPICVINGVRFEGCNYFLHSLVILLCIKATTQDSNPWKRKVNIISHNWNKDNDGLLITSLLVPFIVCITIHNIACDNETFCCVQQKQTLY